MTFTPATDSAPPPDLSTDPQEFFRAGPDAAALTGVTIASTSALKLLGPSPFPKSGFPLLGFLDSAYDHLAEHAAKRLPAKSSDPMSPVSRII